MIFSSPSDKQGIVEMARFLVDLDSTQFPKEEVVLYSNTVLDDFVTMAIQADGDWSFDGSSHIDKPEAVKNIVSGQADYLLNDGVTEFLQILKVEVKDDNGVWSEIPQRVNYNSGILSQTDSGKVSAYDLRGNSLFLFPIPDSNITGGLKIYFSRNVDKFAVSDTNVIPPIPSIFHAYIAKKVASLKAIAKGLSNTNQLLNTIQMEEQKIQDYYGKRNRSVNPIIRARRVRYR